MMWQRLSFLVLLMVLLAVVAPVALAQNPLQNGLGTARNTANSGGLSTREDIVPVITNVILWLLRISALLAIGALVWGGIMYIMSLGNESRAEKAKEVIKYALIGVIVILLSYAIIAFVQSTLKGAAFPGVTAAYAADGFIGALEEFKPKATGAGLRTKDEDIFGLVTYIIQWLLALSAVLAMGAFVWGGIMYITSLGDEGKAEKAKNVVKFAVIGIIVILVSYVIVVFLQTQLTAANPFGVPAAYAATDVSKGFKSGIKAIDDLIKPKESGLATDPDIITVILRVVNFMLGLVAVLALAAMVWGAIMYILAIGDESRAEKAKNIILYAIIGVLLAAVSFVILTVLQNLFTGP